MIFRLLSSVPLVGDVVRIFNSYAYSGDGRAEEKFAPVHLWFAAFWLEIGLSFAATLFCMPSLTIKYLPIEYQLNYSAEVIPGPLATSVLPNILGFGVGVYALIFGLHKILLIDLQDSYESKSGVKKSPGSALILNAEMAVPLLVLAVAIVIGLVQQIAPKVVCLQIISWFSLWLSLIFTIELILTLFGRGENVILKTLDDTDKKT